jgi:outer membrane biosynthesis protein TonB
VTDLTAAQPIEQRVPPPVVDPDIDGVFHLPPSRDAKRQAVPIGTILAALLLHLFLLALLLAEWRTAALPPARALQVELVPELPKPKTAPPKPKPRPEPPKPKPVAQATQPVETKPRESGSDAKTEAAKHDKPNPAPPPPLPVQPKAAEVPPPPTPLPQPPEPKPTSPRVKAAAIGKGVPVPREELPPALRPERPVAPPMRNLVLRLPSPGSGNAERDFVGDPYLNRLMQLLQRNRIYPLADQFAGALSRYAIYGVVIEPSGAIVNIKLIQPTGVSMLDEAGREMITNSSPFPHLPADYPQIRTYLTVVIPIYPAR